MAAGIARRYGVDVSLVRLAFVVATAAGGFGLGAYLLGWILIPPGDSARGRSRVPTGRAAVEVALDVSGRNFVIHEVDVPAETIGTLDTGLVEDFVRALAQAADLTVHVRLRSGRSPHHVVEAEFKALAKALGDACALTGPGDVPSTKGTL